ncbi:hypothetical protein DXG01_016870 [Tephrocybe rancida]|nr:hypothetical protein DXG01_016870 [Tephrocybe rancida]
MPPRRSSRLASSTSQKPSTATNRRPTSPADNDYVSAGPDYREEEYEDDKPKKKRPKKSTKPKSAADMKIKNVRGRRGALKDLVEMPLDILHEIFMYLNPVEVLYLSRMCKILSKSAEFIWRQARLNHDEFPECPDDLNEHHTVMDKRRATTYGPPADAVVRGALTKKWLARCWRSQMRGSTVTVIGYPEVLAHRGKRILMPWAVAISHALQHAAQGQELHMTSPGLDDNELKLVKELQIEKLCRPTETEECHMYKMQRTTLHCGLARG